MFFSLYGNGNVSFNLVFRSFFFLMVNSFSYSPKKYIASYMYSKKCKSHIIFVQK
jgi:hypothetical protein